VLSPLLDTADSDFHCTQNILLSTISLLYLVSSDTAQCAVHPLVLMLGNQCFKQSVCSAMAVDNGTGHNNYAIYTQTETIFYKEYMTR